MLQNLQTPRDVVMLRSPDIITSRTGDCVTIRTDSGHSHTFDQNSRVSKALKVSHIEEIAQSLTDSNFFFVDGELMDFRPRAYNGYVANDDTIDQLVSHIGFTEQTGNSLQRSNITSTTTSMQKLWSKSEIELPNVGDGGIFESSIFFKWNPFSKHVSSSFKIMRLVCENGMMGNTSLLNAKVPLENRWDEHLTIASDQLSHSVNEMSTKRLSQMVNETASVYEIQRVNNFIRSRQEKAQDGNIVRLMNLEFATNDQHMNAYKHSILSDSNKASQLPGHLTTFDLYNVVTEVNSHTEDAKESSGAALDKFATSLVFDRKNEIGNFTRFTRPTRAAFSSPEQAFFAEVA